MKTYRFLCALLVLIMLASLSGVQGQYYQTPAYQTPASGYQTTAPVLAVGSSAATASQYSQYYTMQGATSTHISAPIQFNLASRVPNNLYFGTQNQAVPYAQYMSNPAYASANSLWIQGATDWTQYATVPQGATVTLVAVTRMAGNGYITEIHSDGTVYNTNYYFYPYSRMTFYADAIGRHIVSFNTGGQSSNTVVIDVTGNYPTQATYQPPVYNPNYYSGYYPYYSGYQPSYYPSYNPYYYGLNPYTYSGYYPYGDPYYYYPGYYTPTTPGTVTSPVTPVPPGNVTSPVTPVPSGNVTSPVTPVPPGNVTTPGNVTPPGNVTTPTPGVPTPPGGVTSPVIPVPPVDTTTPVIPSIPTVSINTTPPAVGPVVPTSSGSSTPPTSGNLGYLGISGTNAVTSTTASPVVQGRASANELSDIVTNAGSSAGAGNTGNRPTASSAPIATPPSDAIPPGSGIIPRDSGEATNAGDLNNSAVPVPIGAGNVSNVALGNMTMLKTS